MLNLAQMIRARACQRGSGGRPNTLRAENLSRIGFVERAAGQRLPQISRLFIQYVLDPVSVFKSNPDMKPTELKMTFEEQIFYLMAHRRIINSLQNIIEVGARQDIKLDGNSMISAVKVALNTRPATKMPWEEPIWTEMLENAALKVARSASGRIPRIDVRNLVSLGLLSPRAEPTIYRRATERLVHFVIDPADSMCNNPYQQPFRVNLSADETRVYVNLHKIVIELLKPAIVDIEAGSQREMSTQARAALLLRIIQQI